METLKGGLSTFAKVIGYIVLVVVVVGSITSLVSRTTDFFKISGGLSFSGSHFTTSLNVWRCVELIPDPRLNGTECKGFTANSDGFARTLSHGGRPNK